MVVDLLQAEEISELKNFFYQSGHHTGKKEFYTTTWLTDNDLRLKINEEMKKCFAAKLDTLLNNYTYFYGSYFVKESGEQGDCVAHQDWTCTQEPECASITVWCALQDVDTTNGCLRIFPFSHHLKNYIRGRHLPDYLSATSSLIHRYLLKPIPLKKGQAILFNQRLVHGSTANSSSDLRIACGLVAAPAEQKLIHYVGDGSPQVKMISAANDLFSRYDTFDKMESEPALKHLTLTQSPLSRFGLLRLMCRSYFRTWFS